MSTRNGQSEVSSSRSWLWGSADGWKSSLLAFWQQPGWERGKLTYKIEREPLPWTLEGQMMYMNGGKSLNRGMCVTRSKFLALDMSLFLNLEAKPS